MQMCYLMMTRNDLSLTLELREIDNLSLIIAAACHDLGHDGFNNSYHLNAITKRAIDSNDVSIQENYHAAELFRIMQKEDCNFLEYLSRTEFIHFRKRVTSLILATDMSKHAAMISSMKQVVSVNNIKNNLDVVYWLHSEDKDGEVNELSLFVH